MHLQNVIVAMRQPQTQIPFPSLEALCAPLLPHLPTTTATTEADDNMDLECNHTESEPHLEEQNARLLEWGTADSSCDQWKEWEESFLKEANQILRIKQWHYFTQPAIDAYYEKLELPTLTFPSQPPDDAPYEEKQKHLVNVYRMTFELALPDTGGYCKNSTNGSSRQTTLQQDLILYQQLKFPNSTSAIRLLEILPGSPEEPSITTRLVLADVDSDGLQYEALSYAWGSLPKPQDLLSIRVNGLTRRIPPNLHSALISLRSPSEKRILWIDSICINQSDLEERSQQVTLMAKIYARASRVLVYLGPSSPPSTAYFTMLQGLEMNGGSKKVKQSGSDIDNTDLPAWEAVSEAGLDAQNVIDGFIDVCTRSWWTRLWVLQEYTLSKQDPWIYCGPLKVSNQTFQANFFGMFEWVQHRKNHPSPIDSCWDSSCIAAMKKQKAEQENSGKPTETSETKKTIGGIDIPTITPQANPGRDWGTWGEQAWHAHVIMERRTHPSPWTTPSIFYRSLKAECSDPHDMVYGVRELMEPIFRDIFRPDYSLPVSTLFTQLASYMFIFDTFLDMFWCYPHSLRSTMPTEKEALLIPSWVPDFTKRHCPRFGDQLPCHHAQQILHPCQAPRILKGALLMDGWVVDEIVRAFPLPSKDPFGVLQQLWQVERIFTRPTYREDPQKYRKNPDYHSHQRYIDILHKHKGLPLYPSMAWASRFAEKLLDDITIVDHLANLPNFATLLPVVKEFIDRIPASHITREDPEAEIDTSRERHIAEMSLRLLYLWDFLLMGIRTQFVGICAFDYENLRSQVLHRLVLVKEGMVLGSTLQLGCISLDQVNTHQVIVYDDLIELIEKDCENEAEMRLREEAVVYLASKIHDAVRHMVGLEGHVFNQYGEDNVKSAAADGNRVSQKTGTAEYGSIDRFITVPLSRLRSEKDDEKGQAFKSPRNCSKQEDEETRNPEDIEAVRRRFTTQMEGQTTEVGAAPHSDTRHPHKAWQRWQYLRGQQQPEVDVAFCEVVDFLAGREFFVTRRGFLGLTIPGTQGVQPGDDLMVIQGMSFPLIGRKERSSALRGPRERTRREIVGTAVVKDLDVNGKDMGEMAWPGDFVPLSGKECGTLFFA